MGCLIFSQMSACRSRRVRTSPRTRSLDLENMFATEFSANLGMSKQSPLRVVGDIGGGGALAEIEKGRKIMRGRKSE